ncbi:MAG: PaaI family thioesterase [Proteobacteria bacterium]|nr:PaaI family thioesterase [Pseudomonadota bacterium]
MTAPLEPIQHIPFLRLLGVHQHEVPPGHSHLVLPELKPEHMNSLAAAHGGVVMTLLDVAMARAARTAPGRDGGPVVTVEMSSRFLRPGSGPLTARGHVLHAGRSLCSCQAELRDAEGRLVASAAGTFKYWKGATGGVD